MRIRCPNCGKKYEIPERHIGRKFDCLGCGKRIRAGSKKASASAEGVADSSEGMIYDETDSAASESVLTGHSGVLAYEPEPAANVSGSTLPVAELTRKPKPFKPVAEKEPPSAGSKLMLPLILLGVAALIVAGILLYLFVLKPDGSAPESDNAAIVRSNAVEGVAAEGNVQSEGNDEPESGANSANNRADNNRGNNRAGNNRAGNNRGNNRPGNNRAGNDTVPGSNTLSGSNTVPGNRAVDRPAARNVVRWIAAGPPVITPPKRLDPTLPNYDPLFMRQRVLRSGRDLLMVGLNYGGSDFLQRYSQGMKSAEPDIRIDSAIAAANWGHEVPDALRVLLTDLPPKSDQVEQVRIAVMLLRHYRVQADEQVHQIELSGSDAEKESAISWVVRLDSPDTETPDTEMPGDAELSPVSDSPYSYASLLESAFAFDHISVDADSASVAVAGLKPFDFPTSRFDVDLPELNPEQIELQVIGQFSENVALARLTGESIEEKNARLEQLRSDPASYSFVNGLRMSVSGGEFISLLESDQNADSLDEFWRASSIALADNLITDVEFDSGADFDRIRFFSVNGIPKAERYSRTGDSLYHFRWVGRHHDTHPEYVLPMLESFKLR